MCRVRDDKDNGDENGNATVIIRRVDVGKRFFASSHS